LSVLLTPSAMLSGRRRHVGWHQHASCSSSPGAVTPAATFKFDACIIEAAAGRGDRTVLLEAASQMLRARGAARKVGSRPPVRRPAHSVNQMPRDVVLRAVDVRRSAADVGRHGGCNHCSQSGSFPQGPLRASTTTRCRARRERVPHTRDVD
jgi:hypothetical protein